MPNRAWTKRLEERHPLARHESLLDLVGRTPLVRLQHLTSDLPASVEVWVKLESMNPGGSVKDRPARQILRDALERGDLGDGKILIDATSGNTGIAYAMLGAALGVEVHLVMPGNVSLQRKHIVETFGAKVIFSDPMDGSDGAIRLCRQIVTDDVDGRYFYANQYGNPSNPRAHELTTAPEIWEQTGGRVTHFLASTGTSGTIMGCGRGLKGFSKDIQVIGCQPSDAFHGLEGLKHMPSSIVPAIYHEADLDDVMYIETEDGWDMAERLAAEEGIAAGNSAGANVWAALKVARRLASGVVVTVICDHADRYFGE
ncbi:MAG: PLP-dependent cysteine synthase family protein [Bradymonadaceae bacterium]